jgi:hypothetical protein
MSPRSDLRWERRLRGPLFTATALSLVVFGCVRLMDDSTLRCESDDDCGSDQKCLYEQCVAPDACSVHADCARGQRCGPGRCEPAECLIEEDPACGGFRCNVQYRLCDDRCSSAIQCRPSFRCRTSTGTCEVPFPNGDSCSHANDCAGGVCCNYQCATECAPEDAGTPNDGGTPSDGGIPNDGGTPSDGGTPGDGGMPNDGGAASTCTSDSDCGTMFCCASATSAQRLCRRECPPLTGDYCTDGALSARDCVEANTYCDGPTNFPEDGYCSRACGTGCGYASNGLANVCVGLTPGSSPASVCKPGCTTDADCKAIHPDLFCFGTGRGACDFDTSTWNSP